MEITKLTEKFPAMVQMPFELSNFLTERGLVDDYIRELENFCDIFGLNKDEYAPHDATLRLHGNEDVSFQDDRLSEFALQKSFRFDTCVGSPKSIGSWEEANEEYLHSLFSLDYK